MLLVKTKSDNTEGTVQTHLCDKPYRHAHPLTPGPVMTLCEIIMEKFGIFLSNLFSCTYVIYLDCC